MMRNMFSPRICWLAVCVTVLAGSASAQFPGTKKNKVVKPDPAPRNAIHAGTYLELGPLLGHVSSSYATVWAKASGAGLLSVVVGKEDDLSDRVGFRAPKLDAATFFSAQILVTDLQPATHYYYAMLIDGELVTPRPYPSFTTAPREGASGHQRIAFVSCVGYNGFDSAATLADADTRTNFDVLLMLGDNHYGNTTDPAKHFEMFGVQRSLPGYAEISRRVPQYAIWDNHDYSPEPCDKTQKNKAESLRAFKMLWPNPSFGEPDNPGVYFKFTRGDTDFFMLDDRYNRDPNNAPEDGHKSQLGEKQLVWLKRELLASKSKIKMLAIGGEWETHGLAASWASFLRERNDLFQFIEDNHVAGVLLISGDRHFTAAYQVAGKFIEVTSGPLGSKNSTTKPTPEMFFYGCNSGKFYCIYDIDTASATEPQVTLEVYRASEGLVLRRPFTWDEVLGKTTIKPLPATTKTEANK